MALASTYYVIRNIVKKKDIYVQLANFTLVQRDNWAPQKHVFLNRPTHLRMFGDYKSSNDTYHKLNKAVLVCST